MINKAILVGNLGQDPEVRVLENGASVAKFSIATNERYKDKMGEMKTITEWHNIVAWRGLAEIVEKYLKKGSLVYIEGKITTRKWQDQNGNDRYTTEVVARELKMLDRRENSGGGMGNNSFPSSSDELPQSKATTAQSSSAPAPKEAVKAQAPVDDDDLPF